LRNLLFEVIPNHGAFKEKYQSMTRKEAIFQEVKGYMKQRFIQMYEDGELYDMNK
jgi:hypothetical protein